MCVCVCVDAASLWLTIEKESDCVCRTVACSSLGDPFYLTETREGLLPPPPEVKGVTGKSFGSKRMRKL